MSDQGAQYDQEQGDEAFDAAAFDAPTTDELQEQVNALAAQQYEAHAADFLEEFPEYAAEEKARELVSAAQERAAAMGAPHIAADLRHLRSVAAELRLEQQEEAARPMTNEERFEKFVLRREGGSSVLPF